MRDGTDALQNPGRHQQEVAAITAAATPMMFRSSLSMRRGPSGSPPAPSLRCASATPTHRSQVDSVITGSIRYMQDLTNLSESELADADRALRHERLRRRGAWRDCEHCGEAFLERGDARFCSARCRVAAHRAGKGAR